MRRLFGCPDIVSLTEKFLMARNFFRIFTENNPVMGYSKTFCIPEAKGLRECFKIGEEDMDVMFDGRLFQSFGPKNKTEHWATAVLIWGIWILLAERVL